MNNNTLSIHKEIEQTITFWATAKDINQLATYIYNGRKIHLTHKGVDNMARLFEQTLSSNEESLHRTYILPVRDIKDLFLTWQKANNSHSHLPWQRSSLSISLQKIEKIIETIEEKESWFNPWPDPIIEIFVEYEPEAGEELGFFNWTQYRVNQVTESELKEIGRRHCKLKKLPDAERERLRKLFSHTNPSQTHAFFHGFCDEFNAKYIDLIKRQHHGTSKKTVTVATESLYLLLNKLHAFLDLLPEDSTILNFSNCTLLFLGLQLEQPQENLLAYIANRFKHLETLNLNHCGLSTHYLKNIKQYSWRNLKELNFQGGIFKENKAEPYRQLIKHMPKLERVDLRDSPLALSKKDQLHLRNSFSYIDILFAPEDDYENALSRHNNAANQGDVNSQLYLSALYLEGKHVKQDFSKTIFFLQLAANQGHFKGQKALGYLYEQGIGVKQDDQKAIELYKLAANQGYHKAQFNLGHAYEIGKGVKKDLTEAIKLYQLAANQGYDKARLRLAFMHLTGQGLEKNIAEAIKIALVTVQNEDPDGQNFLGWIYYNGKEVPQDFKEAGRLFRLAADQGHPAATYNLGFMFENGQGFEKDEAEAIRLYTLAVQQRDPSQKALNRLKKLTSKRLLQN